MRITSGKLRNRIITVPDELELRPTTERVREAIFSVIGSLTSLEGKRVLDLYAGSGALGIEAISRGAAEAIFVENKAELMRVLQASIESLKIGSQCRVVHSTVESALRDMVGKFDVILADPPYQAHPGPDLLSWLGNLIAPNGIVVVESDDKLVMPETLEADAFGHKFNLLKRKIYGDTAVWFYK